MLSSLHRPLQPLQVEALESERGSEAGPVLKHKPPADLSKCETHPQPFSSCLKAQLLSQHIGHQAELFCHFSTIC